jgi:hypothetical protein
LYDSENLQAYLYTGEARKADDYGYGGVPRQVLAILRETLHAMFPRLKGSRAVLPQGEDLPSERFLGQAIAALAEFLVRLLTFHYH